MNCGLLSFFTHAMSANEPSLCLWRILYSGERSSRCVWAIWFMMLSTVCFLPPPSLLFYFFKFGLLEMGVLWHYFLKSPSITFAGISNRFALWKMRMPRGMSSCGSYSLLTDQFDHFTFFISQRSRSILQSPGPCRQDISSRIIVGSSCETGESYCTRHTWGCKQGNIIKLKMKFFLSWTSQPSAEKSIERSSWAWISEVAEVNDNVSTK